MQYTNSLAFAQQKDAEDPLKGFRGQFHIPQVNDKDSIYLCGNSLGLQPKRTEAYMANVMETWRTLGVNGHFQGQTPFSTYFKQLKPGLAHITGAKENEVVPMNYLTPNLHFMLVSFYQPKGQRYKIIMEAGAFPSDQYAIASQVAFHGHSPQDAIIELAPREGEHTLRTADILEAIEENKESLALVMFSGLQYYTGQRFDMPTITQAGHAAGAYVGWDLAHAVGNLPLNLHEWGPDFAVWCSYKYLNSGPGNVSGVFVHERHATNSSLPRFAGWWGHHEGERFLMEKNFKPMPGADGWQQSNGNAVAMAMHHASLDMFVEAGMSALRAKSLQLTGYLQYIVDQINSTEERLVQLTPRDPEQRGCQLSLYIKHGAKTVFENISKAGIICDYREPNVVRLAPTPLYNTFEDVYRVGEIFADLPASV